MNQSTPPSSRLNDPEVIGGQLVTTVATAITGWVARQRQHGLVPGLIRRLFPQAFGR